MDLESLGYGWQKFYLDPLMGVYTNIIESHWFAVKRTLPCGGRFNLSSYLPVYL
jgi:hypothetical protein